MSEAIAFDSEHPLSGICQEWLKKIATAREHKKRQFSDDAAECMNFYNGAMDVLYDMARLKESSGFRRTDAADSNWPAPTFQMQTNKVAECVQLFGPILYHDNPTRQANPRKKPELPPGIFEAMQPVDPMAMLMGPDPMQQQMTAMQEMSFQAAQENRDKVDLARAKLVEWMLNYTVQETNHKTEARMVVEEAIIKGMGCGWCEVVTPADGGPRLVTTVYDTVDNLQMDSDAERLEDCKWIARRCIHPVWEVERLYQLPEGSLKNYANLESHNKQSATDDDARRKGTSNDLITYWKIYSKMGVGARLQGVDERYRATLDQFGDYAFLVIAEGVPFPLNLPAEVLTGPPQEALRRLDWPTPYWLDRRWPMAPLFFHRVPRQLWPMSHFKPAMGELKALNWLYSMIISKIGITCRDFLAILQSAGKEIEDAITHGPDYTVIRLKATHPGSVDQLVQFLQHPELNGDVWKVLEAVKEEFEKRTGLSELIYGMTSRQMRSASEATLKADQINVRPDDMATKVEEWCAEAARNEALCTRWHIGVKDVAPLMGPECAHLWGMLVVSADPYLIVRQLQYGIEAGSAKKPNKERDAANLQQMAQNLLPILVPMAQMGIIDPLNNMIFDMAKSMDLDGTRYMVVVPPPPPPPPSPEEGGEPKQEGGQDGGGIQVGAPPMGGPPPVMVGM